MLSLMLKDGEYLTIGGDIVVQVFTSSAIKRERLQVAEPPVTKYL